MTTQHVITHTIQYAVEQGWMNIPIKQSTDSYAERKREWRRKRREANPPPPRKPKRIPEDELDPRSFASKDDYWREYRKITMRKVREREQAL